MTPRILVYLFPLFCAFISLGQDLPDGRKAQAAFEKAQKSWQARQIPEALKWYEIVTELDPKHYPSYLKLAQISELERDAIKIEKYYSKVIDLKPLDTQTAAAYLWLARNRFQKEKYDTAQYYFEKALKLYPEQSHLYRLTDQYIQSSKFAILAKQRPLSISKESVGETVNYLQTQYFPVLTADNETLIFTGQTQNRNENIYISNQKEGIWQMPQSISEAINSENNEGTCSISADGSTLVFTACNRQDGYGSCDLYLTKKEGRDWSVPENMGQTINSHFWESQPSLSADGHTLYFASDRKNGFGKKDIWFSKLQNGVWTKPINAGKVINSTEDETAPFIHANGQTLFFSSNGYPGMGGFDVFLSNQIDTTWSTPLNLGYPINTVTDQVGMFIASDGSRAYYTDDVENNGNSKIYTFLLPAVLKNKITTTHYAKGKIIDSQSKQPLRAAIKLVDLNSKQVVSNYQSDAQNGTFLAVLNQGNEYAFYVDKKGYLFKSLTFSVQDSLSTIDLLIPLESINKNKKEILHNIFFKSGSAELDDRSLVELTKLSVFLSQNPELKIKISGYTDNVGSDETNHQLSKQRAENVLKFLVTQQIKPERLLAEGYGKAMPIAPNDTEENRQKNRRIEWSIQ